MTTEAPQDARPANRRRAQSRARSRRYYQAHRSQILEHKTIFYRVFRDKLKSRRMRGA